ncbi:hypothetical protein TNCV_1572561 [Trichonephila clavipes]|uniref:Uncharacterized protein n=1 Tax=Trichonephila clavipes TaxID=2585209 RepID=A0A8X6SPQ7_TRICX|nr:hypothetical protein TNCV_1572561 [Trichonephila clavipes]
MNKIRKTPARLDCPIVLSKEFIAVGDDNVCTARIRADKEILVFVRSSKNIIDADSDECSSCSHVIQNEEHFEKHAQLFRRTFQW